jgi:hypothetical protein
VVSSDENGYGIGHIFKDSIGKSLLADKEKFSSASATTCELNGLA